MTFPQPAGYYSLDLPTELQERVAALSFSGLASLSNDLALYIYEVDIEDREGFEIDTASLTVADDAFISAMSIDTLISFQRWICDRLAFLHTVPVQEVAK